jgi:hypothetical protein
MNELEIIAQVRKLVTRLDDTNSAKRIAMHLLRSEPDSQGGMLVHWYNRIEDKRSDYAKTLRELTEYVVHVTRDKPVDGQHLLNRCDDLVAMLPAEQLAKHQKQYQAAIDKWNSPCKPSEKRTWETVAADVKWPNPSDSWRSFSNQVNKYAKQTGQIIKKNKGKKGHQSQ